jgi:predicted anti-sigma-YlaC factor YlaD
MTHGPACAEVRTLLADRLDGLLERADEERVDAHLAACLPCADHAERARARLATLHTPWEVPAAADDLPRRAREAFARTASGRTPLAPGRAAFVLLRYAATFAAGVLVTLLAAHPTAPAAQPPTIAAAPPVSPAPETPSPVAVDFSSTPRRIR